MDSIVDTIELILNKDIVARDAANLNFKLNNYKSTIYFQKINDSNIIINAKSLIGLLQGHFRQGEAIKVFIFDMKDISELDKIKETLNEIGGRK